MLYQAVKFSLPPSNPAKLQAPSSKQPSAAFPRAGAAVMSVCLYHATRWAWVHPVPFSPITSHPSITFSILFSFPSFHVRTVRTVKISTKIGHTRCGTRVLYLNMNLGKVRFFSFQRQLAKVAEAADPLAVEHRTEV